MTDTMVTADHGKSLSLRSTNDTKVIAEQLEKEGWTTNREVTSSKCEETGADVHEEVLHGTREGDGGNTTEKMTTNVKKVEGADFTCHTSSETYSFRRQNTAG